MTTVGRWRGAVDEGMRAVQVAVCDRVRNAVERVIVGLLPRAPRVRGSVIVIVIMGFYAGFTGWSIISNTTIDFANYYVAAVAFLTHESPYGMTVERFGELARLAHIENFAVPYFYPPFGAVLVVPLAMLPFSIATAIWNMANGAAVVIGTALLLGEKRWEAESVLVWVVVLGFVPMLTLLHLGQISGLLYLLVAFAIYAHERGWPMSAGAALACGALIKITPIVLVGYFLWRGDWRTVAGSLLGAVVLISVTLPIVGLAGWVDFFAVGLGTFHTVDSVAFPPNFTLNGMYLRLFTDNQWVAPVALAPEFVRPLWIASALIIVSATVAACWPPLRRIGSVRFEIAFILIALQLIPHFTWSHQLTLSLLPACVVLLGRDRSDSYPSRWFCGVMLVVALVDLHAIAWRYFNADSLLLSVPLVAVTVLWAAMGIAIVRERGFRRLA